MSITVAELVARLRADTGDFSRGMDRATRDSQRAERSAMNLQRAMGGVQSAFNSAAVAISGLSAMAGAWIYDSIQIAGRVEEMNGVLKTLGGNIGISEAQIKSETKAIKEMGITTAVAQRAVSQFIKFNLDFSKAADVARVAQDAAVLSMSNSSETLDRILYGIQTYQTEILRTAGLNVNMGRAFDEYAKSIHKTTGELTESEKQQAAMNAILDEGENIAGAYASAMESAGKQLRSIPRYMEDIKERVGNAFMPAFDEGVHATTALVKSIRALVDEGMPVRQVLDDAGNALAGLIAHLTPLATKLGQVDFAEWIERASGAAGSLGRLAAVIAGVGTSMSIAGIKAIPFVGQLLNFIPPVGKVTAGLIALIATNKEARDGIVAFATATLKAAGAVSAALAPAIDGVLVAVTELLPSLLSIGTQMVSTLTPAAVGFARAASGLVTTLTPVAEVLADLLGWISRSKTAVVALTAAFVAWKSIAITNALIAMAVNAKAAMTNMLGLGNAVRTIGMDSNMAARQTSLMQRAFSGLSVGVAAATIAVTAFSYALMDESRKKAEAKARADELAAAVRAVVGEYAKINDLAPTDYMKALEALDPDKFLEMSARLSEVGVTLAEVTKAFADNPFDTDALLNDLIAAADKGTEMSDLISQGLMDVANMRDVLSQQTRMEWLEEDTELAKRLQERFKHLGSETKAVTKATGALNDQWRTLAGIGDDVKNAMEDVDKVMQSAIDPMDAYANATKRVQQGNKNAQASLNDWLEDMRAQQNALGAWEANLKTLADKGYGALAIEMAKKGPEYARLVEQMVNGDKATLGELEMRFTAAGQRSSEGLLYHLYSMKVSATQVTGETINALAMELNKAPRKVREIMAETGSDFATVLAIMDGLAHSEGSNIVSSLAAQLGMGESDILAIMRRYRTIFQQYLANIEVRVGVDALGMTYTATNTGGNPVRVAADGFVSYARGTENHIAQIARGGDMRLWAEPETGGEAYIPLAQSKRPRSTAILAEVARKFGMQIKKFARGSSGGRGETGPSLADSNIDWYYNAPGGMSYTAPVDPRKAAKDAADAAEEAQRKMDEIMANRWKMQDIDQATYQAYIAKRLGQEEKFTNEWMSFKDQQTEIIEKNMSLWRAAEDNAAAAGAIDNARYREILMARFNEMRKQYGYWADETQAVYAQIKRLDDENIAHYLETAARQAEVGDMSQRRYREILEARLADLEKYSDDWMAVWRQIESIEEETENRRAERAARALDRARGTYNDLRSQRESLLQDMKQARQAILNEQTRIYESAVAQFKKAQDDLANAVTRRVEEFVKRMSGFSESIAGPMREAGNAVRAFGNDVHISGEMVGMFFDQHTDRAREFADTLKGLRSSGLNQGLLNELAQAGPESIGFAKALAEAVGQGQTGEINARIAELIDMGHELGDLFAKDNAANIMADVIQDIPLPEIRTFNEYLREQQDLARVAAADHATALTWATDMTNGLIAQNAEYQAMVRSLQEIDARMASIAAAHPAVAAGVPGSGVTNASGNGLYIPIGSPIPAGFQELWRNGRGIRIAPRADGGPVMAGVPYLTGERGAELFIPNSDGVIVSNSAMRGMGGSPTLVVESGAIQLSVTGDGDVTRLEAMIERATDDLVEKLSRMLEDQ